MTREAARTGFETFVEDAITHTAEQFSVSRALQHGVRGPGTSVVDRLVKNSETLWDRVVQPELDDYRDRILTQFEVVMDYTESDDSIDCYREEILAVDSYAQALRPDVDEQRREEIHDALVERQRQFGEAIGPLVESPEDDFWAATATTFDREQAATLVEDHFTFTDPFQEYRHAFRMATEFDTADVVGGVGSLLGKGLPTIEVEYTNEAVRSLRRAEQRVITETKRELDRQF